MYLPLSCEDILQTLIIMLDLGITKCHHLVWVLNQQQYNKRLQTNILAEGLLFLSAIDLLTIL